MKKIRILAKSSGSEPYNVDFILEDGKMKVFCNCQAGTFRDWCKHKYELLVGDVKRLYDPEQIKELKQVQEWVSTTGYQGMIEKYNNAEYEKKIAIQTLNQQIWGSYLRV